MNETLEKVQNAYTEILGVINKYKDIVVFDYVDMEEASEKHLFGVELKEKFGLNINPGNIYSIDWTSFGDFRVIGRWGEKYGRTISWSDDGLQPKDEILLRISFSTGAYIFGDDYPKKLFEEFWEELKTYEPKYCDTVNHSLYFSMDNASKIFNDFDSILKKYNEKNREQYKERKIKKMREELNQLEKEK